MADKSIIQTSKHPWMGVLLRLCTDEMYIKIKWAARRMPYKLNLKNPRTFNEKLQWIKLNDHNPLYTKMVDKYLVKEYVAEQMGGVYYPCHSSLGQCRRSRME